MSKMEKEKIQIDGRTAVLFSCGEKNVPAVYSTIFQGEEDEIILKCEKIACPPFNFAAIYQNDWDAELSPWPFTKILSKNDNFLGKGGEYAKWICENLVPAAENVFGTSSFRVIAGYSMAGLFSIYAPTVQSCFDRIVSASGSVWFPDFVNYIEENKFKSKITRIYLSLGDREKLTKNKFMKNVEDCTNQLSEIFKSRGIETFFELNPGNHFQDSALRLAKGIKFIIRK